MFNLPVLRTWFARWTIDRIIGSVRRTVDRLDRSITLLQAEEAATLESVEKRQAEFQAWLERKDQEQRALEARRMEAAGFRKKFAELLVP